MRAYLLGIDVGTSACKVALFRPDGAVVAQATGEYPVYYPQPGWAEQDPRGLVAGHLRVRSESVLAQSGVAAGEIAGIGVDGQSWSAIAVDASGEALCNTPIWTDTRARRECDADRRERVPEETLFSLCGNPVQPSYTLPKILWYQATTARTCTAKPRTSCSPTATSCYSLTGADHPGYFPGLWPLLL